MTTPRPLLPDRLSFDQQVENALIATFGNRASQATQIDVLRNGDEIFPAMLSAIESAQSSIEFGTFVYWRGDIARWFAHALAERARAGVNVRILIDAYGGYRMEDDVERVMTNGGCQVERYNPWNWRRPWRASHRTHRKTLVVDDRVGFTGGVGVASEWEGDARDSTEWRDTHFRFEGSVVRDLRASFIDNWLAVSGEHPIELVPRSRPEDRVDGTADHGDRTFVIMADHADTHNDLHDHFRLLIRLARTDIKITTAYFMPDPVIVEDLKEAVKRGVRVQLLLPGPDTDKNFVRVAARSIMDDLVSNGVEISTYQRTMLHTKSMTIDGKVASIGSANINRRSGHHDKETNVVISSERVIKVLDDHFEDDLTAAVPFEDDSVSDSGVRTMIEDALRPFRPWM